jgi:hypothetical protein
MLNIYFCGWVVVLGLAFCLMLLVLLYLQTPEFLIHCLLYGVFTKKSLAPTLNAGQNPGQIFWVIKKNLN